MVRVRQHQENMWLGGLRRDRAVDQQESHTERPHRRHIMIDIVAAARSRRPAAGAAAAGQFSSGSLLFSQPALAAVDIPPGHAEVPSGRLELPRRRRKSSGRERGVKRQKRRPAAGCISARKQQGDHWAAGWSWPSERYGSARFHPTSAVLCLSRACLGKSLVSYVRFSQGDPRQKYVAGIYLEGFATAAGASAHRTRQAAAVTGPLYKLLTGVVNQDAHAAPLSPNRYTFHLIWTGTDSETLPRCDVTILFTKEASTVIMTAMRYALNHSLVSVCRSELSLDFVGII